MASFTIIEGSEVYLGDKKAMTIKLVSGELISEQYVEMEPFEYMGTDDAMQYVESQDMVNTYLQSYAEQWESNNITNA